mgnify:CR=1 FL=1
MLVKYTYGWKLKENGWEEIPYNEWADLKGAETYGRKDFYVNNYLRQAITESKSGWENIKYKLFKNGECIDEYIILCYDTKTNEGRYINVTGNSLAAIGQVAFDNLF